SEIKVDVIEPWIRELWDRGGSDLLITAGSPPLLRVDGAMQPVARAEPLSAEETASLVLNMLGDDLQTELRRHHEVDFSFSWGDTTRFRGNVFSQRGTIAMALRVIPFYIPSFDELGLPPVIEWFCKQG